MKMLLIATTALISVASLAVSDPVSARGTGSGLYHFDANKEFLCNYGFTIYNVVQSYASGRVISYEWSRAAAPLIGRGKRVSEIIVAESSLSEATTGFSVAIYSGTSSPVNKLVGAIVEPSQGCGRRKVKISRTNLAKGKQYWIVETALRAQLSQYTSASDNAMKWLYDEKPKQDVGLWQSGYSKHDKRHESPWMSIGYVPYARVK